MKLITSLRADFLDPMHHEAATGRQSINLDGWMLSQSQTLDSFHRNSAGCDIAVIEGVMGLYDSRDGKTEDGSTAQIAKWLGAAVVLVLDCWALARSAAALIKGFCEFDKDLIIGGILFNKVSMAAAITYCHLAVSQHDLPRQQLRKGAQQAQLEDADTVASMCQLCTIEFVRVRMIQ